MDIFVQYSTADIAGLKVNDAVLEINGIDVRHVKYEQVHRVFLSLLDQPIGSI